MNVTVSTVEAHVYQESSHTAVQLVIAFPSIYDFDDITPQQFDELLEQSLQSDVTADTRPKLEAATLNQVAPLQVFQKSIVRGKDDCATCAICLDTFRPRKHVRRLPCGHLFCSKCIQQWVSKHNAACPTCRAAVL